MDGKNLNQNLNRYLDHLDSIKDTLPMVSFLLEPYQKKAREEFQKYVKENVEEIEDENGQKSIAVPTDETKIFERLAKNSSTSMLASKIIPESLFVALISQYDAFLNRLLKILFEIRPEYINNSERELTYSQLVEFQSLDDAREYIVEKEIETVLRKSHSEQFEYLENKIGIPLTKNLEIWPKFIEITQRRHLYVHSDGIVTNQYLKVCSQFKCNINEVKVGGRLKVDVKYFISAYACLYELAVKLTHTIWRKLLPDDLNMADRRLNDVCYELMQNGQYMLADDLLEFACDQKKHFNDALKNVYIINKGLSQYLQGNKEKAKEIISNKDWSASSDDFKLANLVLCENYEDCYPLMRKIGTTGEVDKENYKTWPLFKELREKQEFKDVYKEIFGEDYSVLEIPKRPVQELISALIKKNPSLKKKTIKKGTAENKKKEDKK